MKRPTFVFLFLCAAFTTLAAGKAEHVVVVVWDGMRPDFINETNTPTLYQFARDGVLFQNHHAVYLSSTEVNGTAIATGDYPSHNGIFANREYLPAIDPLKKTEMESLAAIRKGDEVSQNHFILVPTIAEILQRAGKRTCIAGTKPVALLSDRLEQHRPCGDCIDLFERKTVPPAAVETLNLPVFAPHDVPNTRQDEATTQALIGSMWDKEVPPFSLLWLSEPDSAQHATGLGSVSSLKAMKSSDDNLGRVLKELEGRHVRDKTDVFVVSDHGFSTVVRTVDVGKVLRTAGFNVTNEFAKPPKDGDTMIVSLGGSTLLYVIGHDAHIVHDLVTFLQRQDFAGVLFTREPMPGTFTLDQVHINTASGPDIVMSLRWLPDEGPTGVPGLLIVDDQSRSFGRGSHSSLSRFDMHNTLVAAGPDFKKGFVDHLPSGNVDIAPTVLSLLGVPTPQPMDGRVLSEALTGQGFTYTPPRVSLLEATNAVGDVIWHQYLKVEQFDGAHVYFDEGNGSSEPKK